MQPLAVSQAEDKLLAQIEDGELLELYVRSEQSPYLEELTRRHFPLVCSVARRQLNNHSDIEDAVQTTFLVLTKSAMSIRRKHSLSAWLYGVAFRTATRIRQQTRHRTQSQEEFPLEDIAVTSASPLTELAKQFQLEALDEELQTVRGIYREVLVEHYLLGRSTSEIAERFNLSQSTIEGRLRRGRKQLRTRMLRRGYSFASAVALIALPAKQATAAFEISIETFVSSLSSAELSQLPSRITNLAAKEMKMITALASKSSSGMIAGVAVATVLGLLSVSSFGDQLGPSSTGESTLVLSNGAEKENAPPIVNTNFVQVPTNTLQSSAVTTPTSKSPAWAKTPSRRLRKKLDEMITPDSPGIPLAQVLSGLSDELKIAIWLDVKQLEMLGVAPDEPVVLNLPPVPIRQALRYILSPLELGYRLEADVLVVSTKEVIDAQPVLRAYDISILSDSTQELNMLVQSLERNIRTIEPEAWEQAVWNIQPMGATLLVGTSEMVHGEIELMLTDLAEQLGKLPPETTSATNAFSRKPEHPSAPSTKNERQPSQDPFGSSSDPIGGAPFAGGGNPFGGSTDPFGNRPAPNSEELSPGAVESANPFGSAGSSDQNPFGESASDNHDPFGGSSPSAKTDDPFGN